MRRTLWLVVLSAAACSGQIGVGEGERSWALETDDSGGLVDPRHPEFGAYPNPRAVDAMLVTLGRDGRLCATAGSTTWCGGVLSGIPYRTTARVEGGAACMSVVDLYGHRVADLCGADLTRIAAGEGAGEAGCVDATAADGRDCRLCTDAAGNVTENTCPAPSSSDDSTIDEFAEDACGGGDAAVLAGARLYVDAANDMLERAGLDVTLREPTRVDVLTSFEDGDLELGSSGCEDVLDYLDDEFADDDVGDDWVFGADAIEECREDGSCRIGQLVTRAMAEACRNVPPGCNVRQMSQGIVGAGGQTVQELCEDDQETAGGDGALTSNKSALLQECVGSPLVLDLDADGLALQGPDGGARFALFGGPRTAVGWTAGPGDALLAVDRDGDGAISGGLELFGEGGGAPDGFAALARHDDDGDGVVGPSDAIYPHLLAWRDDGDGVSAPEELVPLAETRVLSIPVRGAPLGVTDAAGNVLGLEATAVAAGGAGVPVVDVWFRIGRR